MPHLKGITWDHTRGYAPVRAASESFKSINPEVHVEWDVRSLKDFGDSPIEPLVEKYDLLMIDHPFIGTAAEKKVFIALDEWLSEDYLKDQEKNTVGKSFSSYSWNGHQWALAADAAAQVAAYRKDLLEEFGFCVPRTWEEVLRLASNLPNGRKVALPLMPTDAVCCFLSICANIGGTEFLTESSLKIDFELGKDALSLLKKLVQVVHPNSLNMNPINTLNLMSSTDEVVYVPLLFGYSNYSRSSYAKNLIHFADIPSYGDEPRGGVLGGVGISVSQFSKYKKESISVASFIASGEFQKTIYFECGGQPAHRSAWIDPTVNLASNNFFEQTLRTLDLSYLRPRCRGYNMFQEQAGNVIHNFLRHSSEIAETVQQINNLSNF